MTERTFSFEFFPPKTAEGAEKLRATRRQLAQLNPKFFSVTFGAGGSTRDRTLETVREIQADGSDAAPHLSCIGSTEENIRDILNVIPHRYPMLLVDRILEVEEKKRIVGIKNVTYNEPFFQGHFPGHPVMPGVLIIEAMAQVGGMLMMSFIPREDHERKDRVPPAEPREERPEDTGDAP